LPQAGLSSPEALGHLDQLAQPAAGEEQQDSDIDQGPDGKGPPGALGTLLAARGAISYLVA